ncbi:MAG: hypothetical protein AAF821_16885 [Cyanobacteria bacterium P01_D01_bin.156]
MPSPVQLTDSATLGELSLEEAQVTPHTLGHEVVQQFEQRPHLTGVLIIENGQIMGAISRNQLYQGLSQPYALEIFLKRPIQVFLDLNPHCCKPLILDYAERIDVATQKGLSRASQHLFEPIVVKFHNRWISDLTSYFLLNFHTLLLANSEILNVVNKQMQRQKHLLEESHRHAETYSQQLETQQQEIQARNVLLEAQQRQIKSRNLMLENQQQQLLVQSQEIQALNQRFMEIGKVLSAEGKKAFQATFAGVNAICQNTDQIVTIGRLLESELETIQSTSTMIEDVSRHVRQLSVQAAIAVHKLGPEMAGFSYIAEEIAQLVSQTREAGRQMNTLAEGFQSHVQTFTGSAQDGTKVARTLILEIEQAAVALVDLERLLQDSESSPKGTLSIPSSSHREMQSLRQKLASAEASLSDLRQALSHNSPTPIVESRRLENYRPHVLKTYDREAG